VILVYLRGDIVGIYAQKKLDELDEELETQDWEEFIKKIKYYKINYSLICDI